MLFKIAKRKVDVSLSTFFNIHILNKSFEHRTLKLFVHIQKSWILAGKVVFFYREIFYSQKKSVFSLILFAAIKSLI